MYGFTVDLFEGRCVVVTGAARGIGRATALAFAEHGAALVLVDRDANVLEATAREVLAAGAPSCRTLLCDLGVEQQRNDLIRSLEQESRIDILINIAGVFERASDASAWDGELWRRALSVNLDAVAHLSYGCVTSLTKTQGAIVNVASTRAFSAAAGAAAYTASKAAIVGLTHSLAVDLCRQGIRVNTVAPGEIATGIASADPDIVAELVGRSPMRRLGEPVEVSSVILFLASPLASFVTGATWRVDGGFMSA
jgi:NAD(P)-dependent dehydrogenase (short-subunit alcohol dehydrogenase family)